MKRLLIVFPVVVFLSLLLGFMVFGDRLQLYLAEGYLKQSGQLYAPGSRLEIEKGEWTEDRRIVFENLQLLEGLPLEKPLITIEKVFLSYTVDLWNRKIEAHLEAEKPQLFLESVEPNLNSAVSSQKPSLWLSLFHVDASISTIEGSVVSGTQKTPASIQAELSTLSGFKVALQLGAFDYILPSSKNRIKATQTELSLAYDLHDKKSWSLNHFASKEIAIHNSIGNKLFGADALNLQGNIPVGSSWDHGEAALTLKGGNALVAVSKSGACQFQNIEAQFVFTQGAFQKGGTAHCTCEGMDGTATFDPAGAHIAFQGNSDHLAGILQDLPIALFLKSIPEQPLVIQTLIHHENGDWKLAGDVKVAFDASQQTGALNWKCEDLKLNQHNQGLSLQCTQGSFKSHDIPTQTFVKAFLPHLSLDFSGMANVEGKFDAQGIAAAYTLSHFKVENPSFELTTLKETLVGDLHYDHNLQSIVGQLSFEEGMGLDKQTGLSWTGIRTSIQYEPGTITADAAEGYLQGLYFAGTVKVDFAHLHEGVVELDVRNPVVTGSYSNAKEIFAHYGNLFFFSTLPLEAVLSTSKEGSYFHATWDSAGSHILAKINGTLNEGIWRAPEGEVSLQDLSANVTYDHQLGSLEITDIQGTVLTGKPDQLEEYVLAGDYLSFTDLFHHEAAFDIWVGDRQRDILRLVGKTRSLEPATQDHARVAFDFDSKLTHLGPIYPKEITLIMQDWSSVETFHLVTAFQLESALTPLQRFSKTGWMGLPDGFLRAFNELKSGKGQFDLDLYYSRKQNELAVNLEGSRLALSDVYFDTFVFQAKAHQNLWNIENLQLGDLSLAFDLTKEEDIYRMQFLGIRYGHSLLLGVNGAFFPEENRLSANLNLIEIDLEHLNEWPGLDNFVIDYHPQGTLRASGLLNLDLFTGTQGWHAELDLKGSLKNLEIQGLRFEDAEQLALHIDSEMGFTLKDLNTGLKRQDSPLPPIALNIKQVGYEVGRKQLWFEGMAFDIPASQFKWLAEVGEKQFSSVVPSSLLKILRNNKSSHDISGNINLDLYADGHNFHLILEDGKFDVAGDTRHFKDLSVWREQDIWHVTTLYEFHQQWLLLAMQSKSADLSAGECIISLPQSKDTSKLVVEWATYADGDIYPSQVAGELSGLSVQLKTDPSKASKDEWQLEGTVQIEPQTAAWMFPEGQWSAWMQKWKVDSRYALTGIWSIGQSKENPLHFQGILEGNQVALNGFLMDHLSAKLDVKPDEIEVQDFALTDAAGSLRADHLTIKQDEQHDWRFQAPSLVVTDFYPSLLFHQGAEARSNQKPFNIRTMEVKDFQGSITDMNTLLGKGNFHFLNPAQHEASSSFFSVPSDILSKLGLETSVLFPVTGTVDFEIREGKIYLTRFHDVYSHRKLMKFYLAKSTPSYIDWEGQLNLRIGLQPYHVMFKLGDLLTMSVQGTFEKPTFRLKDEG